MTEISIDKDRWLINGEPTYQGQRFDGHRIEGLLMNSRMANALFDDENPATLPLWKYPDTGVWDPERNTDELIAALPEYKTNGLLAITVNLQGGSPTGYYREERFREVISQKRLHLDEEIMWRGLPDPSSQPWHNSAFTALGALKPAFQKRAERLIEACDRIGIVVILGLFYFGQDERIRDEAAVISATDATVEWLLHSNWRNVLLEINNEANIPRYEHEILQPHRVHELIQRAQSHSLDQRRLLVGTSYGGGRVPDDTVAEVSDFIMLHGNGVNDPSRIVEMVEQTRALPGYTPKPIMFTEDDHFDFEVPRNNFLSAVSAYASWGYFDPGDAAGGLSFLGNYQDGYQNIPIDWGIRTPRKRAFFQTLSKVTGAEIVV